MKRFTPSKNTFKACFISSLLVLSLVGCDDDDDAGEGYIKLYNASADSPYVYLTVDEDLSSDSDDDDDHYESTFSGVLNGEAHSNITLDEDTYEYQLGWQDDDDSTDVDDLEVIHQGEIAIQDETIHLIVLSNSILTPEVTIYDIPEIDDEDDSDDDLWNLRVLNVSSYDMDLDVYYSEENESFNEATLIGEFSYKELSENSKVDQDDYVFYITAAGSEEVLFTSESIGFYYASQNIMIVRDNPGVGSSPFVLDKMSDSSVIEYADAESEAQFSVYNAVANHDELPTYIEDITFHIDGVTDEPIIASIPYGEQSTPLVLDSGDYTVDITVAGDNTELLLTNHLFSAEANTNKTVFFYAEEEYLDENADGDVDQDENGDAETEVNLYTLAIENSDATSLYSHEVEVVNLIQDDDFSSVTVYFVRSDETISDALYTTTANYKFSSSVSLPNNTYDVSVVATVNSSQKRLNFFNLVIDENSSEQFLVLEREGDEDADTFKVTLLDQQADIEDTETETETE